MKDESGASPVTSVYWSAVATSIWAPGFAEGGKSFGMETWIESFVFDTGGVCSAPKEKRESSGEAVVGEIEWNSAARGGTKRADFATEASSVSKGK